jgi:hypothetical protein
LILCERIKQIEKVIVKKEKVIYVQDGKVAKIVPDDGTAELGGNNRDEQIGALATNFQLFQRRYEADEETKFQRFKEQTKRMKMINTAVSRGLSWKVTKLHTLRKGKPPLVHYEKYPICTQSGLHTNTETKIQKQ